MNMKSVCCSVIRQASFAKEKAERVNEIIKRANNRLVHMPVMTIAYEAYELGGAQRGLEMVGMDLTFLQAKRLCRSVDSGKPEPKPSKLEEKANQEYLEASEALQNAMNNLTNYAEELDIERRGSCE
jgi:hypothetical protein